MTVRASPSTKDLPAMLGQAVQAYEVARVGHARARRQAAEEHQRAVEALEQRRQAELQRVEAEERRQQALAAAEQERAGHLLAAIEDVERTARALLEKAGLAHIAGAPLRLDQSAGPSRQPDQAVAAAFVAAQTAYVDLRTALLDLSQTYLEAGQWDSARRVLQLLLGATDAPLYLEARDLWCESYYRPAQAALEAGEWQEAAALLKVLLKVAPGYRDVPRWLRDHPPLAWRVAPIRETGYFRIGQLEDLERFGVGEDRSPARGLAALIHEGQVTITDVATRTALRTLKHTEEGVTCVAFSRDGTLLATVERTYHRTVHLWDVDSGVRLGKVMLDSGDHRVFFSPDGRLLYAERERQNKGSIVQPVLEG